MEEGLVIANRYRLVRPLGAGGMGAIWAATHIVTHRPLALKFVHKKNDDPATRKRVLREARAACAVRHPNVVAVHDVIEHDDGTPVLVMDLLEGESLATRLGRDRTLSPSKVVAIARPVLAALSAAHAVGVVHRDLKPDNVFLCSNGEVKILDFGIAKLNGNDVATKESHRLTETGAMIGTPHYMAPEQAFGEADVDARADLWSVGAVLYECLSGVPPTDGQNLGQILKVLATGSIEPLSRRAPELAPELAAVVDHLLRVERSERPASASAVLARLEALTGLEGVPPLPSEARLERSESVTPRPATRDETVGRRRTSWPLALAGALLVLGVVGLTAARLRTQQPAAPPPSPVVTLSTEAPVVVPVATVAKPDETPIVDAGAVVSASPAPPVRARAKVAPPIVASSPAKRSASPSVEPRPLSSSASGPLLDNPTF